MTLTPLIDGWIMESNSPYSAFCIAIEMLWADLKNYVGAPRAADDDDVEAGATFATLIKLINERLMYGPPNRCAKFFDHCIKIMEARIAQQHVEFGWPLEGKFGSLVNEPTSQELARWKTTANYYEHNQESYCDFAYDNSDSDSEVDDGGGDSDS